LGPDENTELSVGFFKFQFSFSFLNVIEMTFMSTILLCIFYDCNFIFDEEKKNTNFHIDAVSKAKTNLSLLLGGELVDFDRNLL
jgi:hypothetical protein